jgi:predicted nucleic-acid-binding protein
VKSVDTNILVRYYAQDDALQSSLALSLFRDEPDLFVTKTVLLEFFWVLTQADKFRFPPEQVMAVFEHLQGLPNIAIEDELSLRTAITWCRAGLEFPEEIKKNLLVMQNLFCINEPARNGCYTYRECSSFESRYIYFC